jgi:hypothetical protein
MDKALGETQQMKKISEKWPLHRIKCFPEINFDEVPGGGPLPTILLEKLLCQIDIINHIPPTKESILS